VDEESLLIEVPSRCEVVEYGFPVGLLLDQFVLKLA
jgi:hypothetical protein